MLHLLFKKMYLAGGIQLFDRLDNWDPFENKKYYASYSEYKAHCDSSAGRFPGNELITPKRYLEDFIIQNGRNSLLTQYSITYDNEISIVPYHGNAVHNIENNNELILAKPYVIANRFQALYLKEIEAFRSILNKPRLKESEIQQFLERHPNFLKNLGYKNIIPASSFGTR
jgi:hypothetical protein